MLMKATTSRVGERAAFGGDRGGRLGDVGVVLRVSGGDAVGCGAAGHRRASEAREDDEGRTDFHHGGRRRSAGCSATPLRRCGASPSLNIRSPQEAAELQYQYLPAQLGLFCLLHDGDD